MYKNLLIALLLAAFGLAAARSTNTSSSPASPTIVATVSLPNQTAPLSSTVLFTPDTTGIFRVTTYMTEVVPLTHDGGYVWTYHLGWTDDAGKESGNGSNGLMVLLTRQTPPSAWAGTPSPGLTSIVEAVGGAPITFSMSKAGSVNGPSTYSLYITVEQLM
jgi:hypothetical protein